MAGGRSDWRVRGPFGDVEIELHPSSGLDAAAQEASLRELSRMVHDFTSREPEARRVLLDVHARLNGLGGGGLRGRAYDLDSGSTRAATIGAELMHAARAGNLVLRRVERRIVTIPIDDVPSSDPLGPPSSSPPADLSWVEIELLDEQSQPVPFEAYVIELPDGSSRTGSLNNVGRAMERDVTPGQCKVSFPNLDHDAWAPS